MRKDRHTKKSLGPKLSLEDLDDPLFKPLSTAQARKIQGGVSTICIMDHRYRDDLMVVDDY